jgi:hypothetical protein
MDASLEHLRELVDTARELGYTVERMSDVSVGALTLLAGLDGHDLPPPAENAIANMVSNLADRHYVLGHLRRDGHYAVTFVTSPSFDQDGHPDLLLGLLVFRSHVSSEELAAYGEAVREAAARVTKQVGGHSPWDGQRAPKCRVGLHPPRRPARRTTGRTTS